MNKKWSEAKMNGQGVAKRHVGLWSQVARRVLCVTLLLGLMVCGSLLAAREAAAAVTVLDAWAQKFEGATAAPANIATQVVSAGSNRLYMVAVAAEYGTATATFTVTPATLNGATITMLGSTNGTSLRQHLWVGYIKQATIPAAAGTLSLTVSGATSGVQVHTASYQGVDQTATTFNASNFASAAAAVNPATTAAVAYLNQGAAVVIADTGSGNTVTAATCSNAGVTQAEFYNSPTNNFFAFWVGNLLAAANGSIATATTVNFTGATSTRSAIAAIAINPVAGNTTTVGPAVATDPAASTIAPGAGSTSVDSFSLQTSAGTDAITNVTVTLSNATAFNNIATVEIASAASGGTVYGSATPGGATVAISPTGLTATTTLVNYFVRVIPKTHAAMPAVPGASYATTATVTALASTNTKSYTDTCANSLTIDNASTANPTGFTGTAGNGQVALTWTNPVDADYNQVVILRSQSAITDVPVEGATYIAPATIGASTVVFAGNAVATTDNTVTNGNSYFYKIFAKDSRGNYSAGATAPAPYSPVGPSITVGNGASPGVFYLKPGDTIRTLDEFTLQTSIGTDTVTAVTLTLSGGGGAPNAYSGIATINITTAGGAILGTLNNPASDNPTISPVTGLVGNTTATPYLVRITPKTHVNMPAPPGALYTIAGTVTGITSANTKVYSDTNSGTIEIDNSSADVPVWGVITPDNTVIDLSWANPLDPDLDPTNSVVVLRKLGGEVTEVPVEGVAYILNDTIGGATVRYVGAVEGFIDNGLLNFNNYYYAIFSKDTNGNYSVAAKTGPHMPQTAVCVHNTATLSISPAIRSAIPTDVAKYTISVKNNDTALCGAEMFTLSLGDTNGTDFTIPSTLSAPTLTLNPGQTMQSFLTVSVKGTATLGNTNVTTINVAGPGVHTASAPPAVTATTTAANPLMHNSKTTSSTKWGTAGWGITGGRYGTFNCFICHEESVVGANGTPNVKKIRATIAMPTDGVANNWPNGTKTISGITFSDTRAGTADYNDTNIAHTTSVKVCEACHTYQGGVEPNNSGVRNHAYNMSTATGVEQNHNGSGNCLSCHPHEGGFKAQGCTSCHGSPLVNYPTDMANSPATGSTEIGKHSQHQADGFNCDYCHGVGSSVSGGTGHGGGTIAVDFTGGSLFAQLEASDGTYNGHAQVTGGYAGSDAGTVNGTRSCANIYCHGGTMYPALADPTWLTASTAACGTCHNDTTADTGWLGSHADHISATGANLNCSACHGAGYSAGTAAPVGHLTGKVKIDLGSYGTYSKGANGTEHTTVGLTGATTYGSCTVTCHGAAATANWGSVDYGVYPAKCNKCHNDGTAGAALINAVPVATKNAHVVHLQAPGTNYVLSQCDACHGTNAQNGTHANHFSDGAYPNGTATYAGSLSAYSSANKNCTNTCHQSTTANLWVATPPALACLDCHTGSYIAGNNVAKGWNATPATGLHAMTAAGVQKHDNTIAGGCAICHVTEDTANHINGTFTADALSNPDRWVTKSGMTYTPVTPAGGYSGTCNGTGVGGACHSDGGNWFRRWSTEANQADTVTAVSSTKCNVCHGKWTTWAQGTTHYKANSSAASTKGNGHDAAVDCGSCHAYGHANYGTNHDAATKNVTMNSNTSAYARNGSSYGTSKAGCTQCHGGAGNATYDFDISYFTANTVVGTLIPMPPCNSCHDNAGKAATVPQVKIGTTAGSSSAHVDADGPGGAAYTINVATPTAKCENCHSGHASGVGAAGDVHIPTTVKKLLGSAINIGFTAPNLITRTSGLSVYKVGSHVFVSGATTGANNGIFTVSAVTDSQLTVTPAILVTEAASGTEVISEIVSTMSWGTAESKHGYTSHGGGFIQLGNVAGADRATTMSTTATTEAQMCWSCHDNATVAVSEWGTNPSPQSGNIAYDYGDLYTNNNSLPGTKNSNWTSGFWRSGKGRSSGSTSNPYWFKRGAIQSTHSVNFDSGTVGITTGAIATGFGRTETVDAVANIRCSWCHDVHGTHNTVNGDLAGTGTADQPYLRGTWKGNPYSEDGPPILGMANWSAQGSFGAVPRANAAPANTGKTGVASVGGWWIDQNSANPNSTTNVHATSGLCEQCHGNNRTGIWATANLGTVDYATGGNEANLWSSGYNGHANSVINGPGPGAAAGAENRARNIFTRTLRGTSFRATANPAHYTDMGLMTHNTSQSRSYRGQSGFNWTPSAGQETTAQRAFAWGTATQGVSGQTTKYAAGTLVLTMPTALTETAHDAQSNYHTFTCSKCHNPHASRLPKLMLTNCLDTNHNTWEDSTTFTGTTAPTGIFASTRHSQWPSAQNCHRVDARATLTTGATTLLGNGWNRATPWREFNTPNATRSTLTPDVAVP